MRSTGFRAQRLRATSAASAAAPPQAFTLVEMLVAMAITLVMMAAVVTLFANVSNSVRNRRATIEMSGQLRTVRNVLQQDLQGATCPGVTWQRPESNHGYIELIEGLASDRQPTMLVQDLNGDGILQPNESQLNPALSPIPRNNISADINNDGKITTQELDAHYQTVGSLVPGGLGDYDDILMLTVRNEHEPFVGRMPRAYDDPGARNATLMSFANWGYESLESPLAEVVWFSIENPPKSNPPNPDVDNFFGEPGMRTIYRRTLLIAPWLNPYSDGGRLTQFSHNGDTFKTEPGLLRMLPDGITVEQAIAAIIAFQDSFDISARLEWDPNIERWKIMANTLADLTKRENRFGHFGFVPSNPSQRIFPYTMISAGNGYSSTPAMAFQPDPEVTGGSANWQANDGPGGTIVSYSLRGAGTPFTVRPFAFIQDLPNNGTVATAQAMLDDLGQVVRVVHGPVPLWGTRRGQDVMMTGVLGFDVRLFDPGAPLYGRRDVPGDLTSPLTVLQPADPGWFNAYRQQLGAANTNFEFLGQGAYVDLGFAYGLQPQGTPLFTNTGTALALPWFAAPRGLSNIYGNLLAPGYSVYDTWSLHYENNGVNEDQDTNLAGQPLVDEGTNGFDDHDPRNALPFNVLDASDNLAAGPSSGPDDVGERETVPPYDMPLRGVQVLVRAYEPDARSIRQVRVNQHFLPE